jgi:PadR family transcriptional regulator, regulatory protein PadR
VKITYPTALVLEALSRGYHYGFDVMDVTHLPSGTVYPILRRLDREDLVTSRWEADRIAQREQRPPRRYYELTAAGHKVLAQAADRYPAFGTIASRTAKQSRG